MITAKAVRVFQIAFVSIFIFITVVVGYSAVSIQPSFWIANVLISFVLAFLYALMRVLAEKKIVKRKEKLRQIIREAISTTGPIPVLKKFKCEGEVLGKLADEEETKSFSNLDPIFQMSAATGRVTNLINATLEKIISIADEKGEDFVISTLQEN